MLIIHYLFITAELPFLTGKITIDILDRIFCKSLHFSFERLALGALEIRYKIH